MPRMMVMGSDSRAISSPPFDCSISQPEENSKSEFSVKKEVVKT
jgi:hypothetical protein